MRALVPLALMLAAAPAVAQEQAPTQATPQENLDCALWAFMLLGSDIEASAEVGLSGAAGWFLGLYEGQTGTNSEQAMRDREKTLSDTELEAISGRCAERMTGFGDQLLRVAEALPQYDEGEE